MDFDWGDGSQTNDAWFPQTHAYASTGPYTVTVTAHYSDGQTSSAATIVNLDDLIALLPPVIKPGFQVEINGVALPGDEVEYIFWDWGDGTGSYGGFIQSHIYAVPGTYTVSVMSLL